MPHELGCFPGPGDKTREIVSVTRDGGIIAHELTFAFVVRAFVPETRFLKYTPHTRGGISSDNVLVYGSGHDASLVPDHNPADIGIADLRQPFGVGARQH